MSTRLTLVIGEALHEVEVSLDNPGFRIKINEETLPVEVFARPGFMDKVMTHARARTWTPPGPDRDTLLRLVAGG